jgi:hypothetical protein
MFLITTDYSEHAHMTLWISTAFAGQWVKLAGDPFADADSRPLFPGLIPGLRFRRVAFRK